MPAFDKSLHLSNKRIDASIKKPEAVLLFTITPFRDKINHHLRHCNS